MIICKMIMCFVSTKSLYKFGLGGKIIARLFNLPSRLFTPLVGKSLDVIGLKNAVSDGNFLSKLWGKVNSKAIG